MKASKQKDKEEKRNRWLKIMTMIPYLRLRYNVVIYEHHIRLKTKSGAFYDYYPKGQRIGKHKDGVYSNYRDLSVNDFISIFLDL
jgi:hypothetical protein